MYKVCGSANVPSPFDISIENTTQKTQSNVRSGSTHTGLASDNDRWIRRVADRRVRPYWWPLWLLHCRTVQAVRRSFREVPSTFNAPSRLALSKFLSSTQDDGDGEGRRDFVQDGGGGDQYGFCTGLLCRGDRRRLEYRNRI